MTSPSIQNHTNWGFPTCQALTLAALHGQIPPLRQWNVELVQVTHPAQEIRHPELEISSWKGWLANFLDKSKGQGPWVEILLGIVFLSESFKTSSKLVTKPRSTPRTNPLQLCPLEPLKKITTDWVVDLRTSTRPCELGFFTDVMSQQQEIHSII